MRSIFILMFTVIVFNASSLENIQFTFSRNTPETVGTKADKFAYSPLKLFDDNPLTTMAISQNTLKEYKGLYFSLDYSDDIHTQITGFSIQPGFFDERYYQKNSRIKSAKIWVNLQHYDSRTGQYSYEEKEQVFTFEDKMIEQERQFQKPLLGKIVEFKFYVIDTYPGSQWQDVCISEFIFKSNSGKLKTIINSRKRTVVKWYCIDKLPVMAECKSDHTEGLMRINYLGKKITSIDYFALDIYEDRTPILTTYVYDYNDSIITVTDGNSKKIVAEYFIQNEKIVKEVVFASERKEFIFTNGIMSSDNVREYIKTKGSTLRFSHTDSGSETDVYDDEDGTLRYSYRDQYWSYLVPKEYLQIQ